MTVHTLFAPLYQTKPYGVNVMPYDPKDYSTLKPWLHLGGFDLAIVPGDNRYAWLARAIGARTIVALAGDGHQWKDWQVDYHISWPNSPCTLAEMFMALVDGLDPPPYAANQWPLPSVDLPALRNHPYCVLHISARNPLRCWPPEHWRQLAEIMRNRGFHIVWSAAPGDNIQLDAISPDIRDTAFNGTLELQQLRGLLSNADLLITVETGITHLCRTVGTPSVVIFGQGNPVLHGNESFWEASSPMLPVFNENIPCRDQRHIFGRTLPWVRRCDRGPKACSNPCCISELSAAEVATAAKDMIEKHPTSIQPTSS